MLNMGWRQYEHLTDDIKNALFKASLAPVFRKINSSKSLNKSGVLPKRVIICGSPRSGTTLMNELMRCYSDTFVMNREELALRFPYLLVKEKYIVTKHPLDFSNLDEIIDTFDEPFIIFLQRDPRDVIVSRHYTNKDRYLVNFPLWKKAINAFDGLDYENKILVRYEKLIENPYNIQLKIADRLKVRVSAEFGDFYMKTDKKHQDIKSLGGIRPIDPNNRGKHMQEQHRDRIREQLKRFPELSDYLIKYGYEKDREWETHFSPNP